MVRAATIACLLLASSNGVSLAADAPPQPSRQVQTGPDGRYQIIFSPRQERDTFLLDTVTGRVWQIQDFTDLKGDPSVWVLMDKDDGTPGFFASMIQKYGSKPTASAQSPTR